MANANDADLLDIEPEALRAAEFMQAQQLLEGLVGRTVVAARVEETRIAVTADDGTTYFFYGFMGEERRDESAAKAEA